MRLALGLALMLCVGTAVAQGCSQCRETVGQTPERTQAAYRRGIGVLMFAGFAVMGAGLVVLRRFR